jgi:hypothetical protein
MPDRKKIQINTPDGWRFSELQLRREANGDLSFNLDALRAILVDPTDADWLMSHPEDHLADVLTELYRRSVVELDAEDPVLEQLIGEVREERRRERDPPACTVTDAATGETLARVSPADVPGGAAGARKSAATRAVREAAGGRTVLLTGPDGLRRRYPPELARRRRGTRYQVPCGQPDCGGWRDPRAAACRVCWATPAPAQAARDQAIRAAWQAGTPLRELARRHGLTASRVQQLCAGLPRVAPDETGTRNNTHTD